MTELIATFKVNRIPDDMHGEDIKDILMSIAEENNLDLISYGTI